MIKKILFGLLIIFSSVNFAQVSSQTLRYRNDAKGDIQNRREGVMDGNLVRTLFYNNGEVGQWPYAPSGEWPKNSGHGYLDGVAVLISTEITAPGNRQVVHPLETSYREWMDKDPVYGTIWGLEPLPGYMRSSFNKPAMNTDPRSWPSHWPEALGLTSDWDSLWYGYFGRGINNSDFETFFVMDDSKDAEWRQVPFLYQPVSSDTSRGGIGLRVEVRGFQWSHVLAEDIIFWHYDIVNLADFVYPKTLFGFYTDCGVGGKDDSEDDCASYDKQIDLAYCYDSNGLGVPDNWKTGYYGYAYLESPGNSWNGVDDDGDGLIDEKRDDGIDNDHDWVPYSDLNSNGKWDPGEPLNDDLGKDGVGPWDPQYNGPDEGEGDGVPTAGEPNFDQTDKDESDQIGLTAVAIYRLGQGGTGGGWPKDDEAMWLKMNYNNFDTSLQRANISMVFASGPFPLQINTRERFSMALVFGSDLADIKFNKETVQQIYNANYNFSKPPLKPNLTAVAGDKKVFLYWDNASENSRDPFLGFQNNNPLLGYKKDFEGYLLYRSEEFAFNDIKVITDSHGDAKYWKPLMQWDLVDSVSGPDPVGINGARFFRGDNTGLQHFYLDTTVTNGKKYYYALVSYDMGDPKFGTKGLQPTECTKIISEDNVGNISFIDINCAVVTPNAPAAGYNPAGLTGDVSKVTSGLGSGSIQPVILNPDSLKDGASYSVVFKSDGLFPKYHTLSYSIVRTYKGVVDTIQKNVDTSNFGSQRYGLPFDGIAMGVANDTSVTIDISKTGWAPGGSNMVIYPSLETSNRGLPWPADYEVRFFNNNADTTYIWAPPTYPLIPVNFKVYNTTEGRQCKIAVKDLDMSNSLTFGDVIQILEFVGPQSTTNSRIAYNISYDSSFWGAVKYPQEGDKFVIKTKRPFNTGDYFTFSTTRASIDKAKAKNSMSNIKVVPNPYISAAKWERVNLNSTGRGQRRIDFINLPTDCTIRIYTVAGALVKTIEKTYSQTNGAASWNLVTEDGMDAAYGLYIYHVDAPNVGTYIGKFAIIK
jgi:hypothetical protein